MVQHFHRCDPDFGRRVAEGIGLPAPEESQTDSSSRMDPERRPAGALGS